MTDANMLPRIIRT